MRITALELCLPFVLASAKQGHLGLGVEPLCAARHVDGLLVAGPALYQFELRLVRCNTNTTPSKDTAVAVWTASTRLYENRRPLLASTVFNPSVECAGMSLVHSDCCATDAIAPWGGRRAGRRGRRRRHGQGPTACALIITAQNSKHGHRRHRRHRDGTGGPGPDCKACRATPPCARPPGLCGACGACTAIIVAIAARLKASLGVARQTHTRAQPVAAGWFTPPGIVALEMVYTRISQV